ncbi:DUF4625 domain-containing protein [Halocola ammonii]
MKKSINQRIKWSFPLTVFFAAILFTGCGKDEDTTAPSINLIQVNGEDGSEFHVDAGSIMSVLVRASDNEDLNQLKLNIHSAGDGHDHEGEGGDVEEVFSEGNWTEDIVTNLGGENEELLYELDVPSDIAGFWHLQVMCIDKEGNEAEPRIVTLHVENEEFPEIHVESTNPMENAEGEIEIAPGGTITFEGEITDNNGLQEIHVELENEETQTVVFEEEIEAAGATSWNLDQLSVVVPEGTASGTHLHLHIHVIDTDGNEISDALEVHVD